MATNKYIPLVIPLPAGTMITVKMAEDKFQELPAFAMIRYFPILDNDDIQRGESWEAIEQSEDVEAYLVIGENIEIPVAYPGSDVVRVESSSDKLTQVARKIRKQIKEGKSEPMDFDQL